MKFIVRRQQGRKSMRALWKAHVVAFLICLAFLHYSPAHGRLSQMGQPYGISGDRPELGIRINQLCPPAGGRLDQVDFHYPLTSGETIEFVFEPSYGGILHLRWTHQGQVRAQWIHKGVAETIATAPATAGLVRLQFETGGQKLFVNGRELMRLAAPLANDFTAFFRIGPRLMNHRVTVPGDLTFRYRLSDPPGGRVNHHFSWWVYLPVLLAASGLLFLLVLFLPTALLALFLPRRFLQTFELTLALLLPFSPLFLISYAMVRDATQPFDFHDIRVAENGRADSTLAEDYSRLPVKQPGEHRVLLIGGSVPRGTPYGVDRSMSEVTNRLARMNREPLVVVNGARNGWMISQWQKYLPELVRVSQAETVLIYANWLGFNIGTLRAPPAIFLLYYYYGCPSWVSTTWLFDPQQIAGILAQYDALQTQARNLGVRLVVLDDAIPSWDPSFSLYRIYRERLLDHLARRNVEVLTFFEPFLETGNDFLFFDSNHLTAAGQELAGRLIWERLTEKAE